MRQLHCNHAWYSGLYTLATRCHTCTAVTLKYTEDSSLTNYDTLCFPLLGEVGCVVYRGGCKCNQIGYVSRHQTTIPISYVIIKRTSNGYFAADISMLWEPCFRSDLISSKQSSIFCDVDLLIVTRPQYRSLRTGLRSSGTGPVRDKTRICAIPVQVLLNVHEFQENLGPK